MEDYESVSVWNGCVGVVVIGIVSHTIGNIEVDTAHPTRLTVHSSA